MVILMTARPFQGREERSGWRVVAAVARTSTASGCEGNETLSSGESEPLMRRVSESLNVRHEYDQQRRTRCGAWCEERAGAAAGAGATRQARGVILSTGNSGKQQGDVKRAGASARTSEHDRAFFISFDQLREDRRPAPHASCTFGALAHAPRTGSF